MILVVTGIHEHGFDRLIRAIDDLVGARIINNVFVQIGYSSYVPVNCKWTRSLDFLEFEKFMDDAHIIITHGGAGCIAGALERNKTTIVVPRLKKYNEHNNDHQLELTSLLEQKNRVIAVYNIKDLPEAISKAMHFNPTRHTGKSQIIEIIRRFLIAEARRKGLL